MSPNTIRLKKMLEDGHDFPCSYSFKFVVPKMSFGVLKQHFAGEEMTSRMSSKGNYLSVTLKKMVQDSEEVITIYNSVRHIEGILCL